MYTTVVSSLQAHDLFSDNSAGSPVDVIKRSEAGIKALQAGIVRGYSVLEWAGQRIVRSSTVPTYANYPSNGKTGYGAFVVGREAMFASELAGKKVARDPNYKVNVSYQTEAMPGNETQQIACIINYNFFLGVAPRPQTNPDRGFRRIRCEVSVV
jgi:hypothetical protein